MGVSFPAPPPDKALTKASVRHAAATIDQMTVTLLIYSSYPTGGVTPPG
jgi:hypothetical protein